MNKFIGFWIGCLFAGMMWACDDETTEQVPALSLGSSAFKTLENITPFRIPVSLSVPATQPVTVTGFIKSENGAKEGVDYHFVAREIVIPEGKSNGYFEMDITDYPEYRPDREFEFEVVGVKGAKLATPDVCRVTIMSNEGEPVLGFANTLATVGEEMQQLSVEVKTDRLWNEEVSFRLRILPEKSTAVYGEHYSVDTTRGYVIPAGDTAVTIPVTIEDDIELNGDRYFEVEIYENRHSVLSSVYATMKVTIRDDEEPVYVCFDRTSASAIESDGGVWLPVRVKGASRVPVTVTLEVRGGTAEEGTDFTFEQRELTLPVGKLLDSVRIDFIDNEVYDLDRNLLVGFASVEGAVLDAQDTLAEVKIMNDDFEFAQLYEDLMGEWTLTIPAGANLPSSVSVIVSGGDTPAEEDENYLKYLVVRCDKFGENNFPAKWRLSYDVETGAMAVVLGEVITEKVNFGGSYGMIDIKWVRPWNSDADPDDFTPVNIFPSKDYKTLTFDPQMTIRGAGYYANGERALWWLTMSKAVMSR
ncbi:MAG: hypothetical protein K2I90_06360 [Odoribacter sp.]|nr:hypothetical protein [Odoribacter sp.]